MSGPFGSSQWMYNPGGGFYDYEIDGSLRFDNSSYMTRTNGTPTDEDVWTFSAWVKRSGTASTTGSDTMLGAGQYPGNNNSIRFSNDEGDDELIIFNGGSGQNKGYKRSTSLYRDNSGWYHVCVSRNGGTIAMEVNGVSLDIYTQVGFDASVNSQNSNGITHYVGASERALTPYSGYMAEVNFIDGQALAASYFGETKSGIWIPKEYSGSYGNNGYHLKFDGNLNDSSGNGNNFTASGISSHDYVLDSPTNNFANLMIHNYPAANSNAFSEGNLRFTPGSGDSARNTNRMAISNMLVSSGKWYAEAYIVDNGSAHFIGVGPKQTVSPTANNTRYAYVYSSDGDSYVRTGASESISTYASSYTVGDVIGIYVDMDAATPVVYFSKNGQWSNGSGSWNQSSPSGGITLGDTFFTESADFSGTFTFQAARASGTVSPTTIWNFGQDDTFIGNITAGGNADANGYGSFKYAPPTNALALCSANLPDPAIDPADDNIPADHFDMVLYTAATSNGTYTHGNLSFRPDFTWIKNRDNVERHFVIDVLRGNTSITDKYLVTNSTVAEGANNTSGTTFSVTDTGYQFVETSINSDELYFNGRTYVGWNWKAGGTGVSNTDGSITSTVSANQDAGFSIVTYTGNATAGATVGHGLGKKPTMIIVKNRDDGAQDWPVQHGSIGATGQMVLSSTAANNANIVYWNNTEPTSSVFSLGTANNTNQSGDSHVAYVFTDIEGYSKAGSYVGNGSSDGPFIYTGFRPAWVMIKNTNSTGGSGQHWQIADNKRDTYNLVDTNLLAENVAAEGHTWSAKDFLSNGFKIRGNNYALNYSGDTYIYLAFAEQPFKYANAR